MKRKGTKAKQEIPKILPGAQVKKLTNEVFFGEPPNLKWLMVWWRKAYALKFRSDLRKNLDGKAYSGFLVGHTDENIEYEIFIPDLIDIITTVHVVFNEIVPNSITSKLQRMFVKVDEKAKTVDEFKLLVGTCHREDGMVYKTTIVVNRCGYIVAYHSARGSDS